jgi:hypothetical protein
MTDMVDLQSGNADGELAIVCSSYNGGPASYSIQNDVNRMKESINQAFSQSPYLKRTGSR